MKTRKITLTGILTALYVVLSAFVKIPLLGDIKLDLGYIAFAVALYIIGPYGIFVGVAGCSIESILFASYGFSISWAMANLVIGIICNLMFAKTKKLKYAIPVTMLACLIGLVVVKSGIECYLYSIPLLVKLPKSISAFVADALMMIVGLFIADKYFKKTEVK